MQFHEHKPSKLLKNPQRCRTCFKRIYPNLEWYYWMDGKAMKADLQRAVDFLDWCAAMKRNR